MRVLKGHVAVVTGAAGGIGSAVARELAREGMDVALADLDAAGMAAVARDIEQLGRRALCVETDVTRKDAMEHLLSRTLSELGSCHLVVNNAGIFHALPMLGASDEQWRAVVDINLWGVIHGCRVFGSHFVSQGEGHIVNTASAAGIFPMPGMCSYSTTKAAVIVFSEQLRWELAESGVGVTVLCPGVVKTKMAMKPGVGLEHVDMEEVVRRSPTPEGLARKLVRAVKRNQGRIRYGPDSYILSWLRLLPFWLLDRLGKFGGKRAMRVVGPNKQLPPV